MASVSEVQSLLRFLKDAKVPVPLAMSKFPALKEASLTTPESLSKAPLPTIQSIFGEEKLAKQVISTAKRVSKKRASSSTSETSQSPKKAKIVPSKTGQELSPADLEASLALPSFRPSSCDRIEAELDSTVLHTNRAPLVVAFVVQLLRYTMPTQPLSSRLSLAQAVMSIGAKARAINLGIQSGRTAEDEGWGEGQPSVRIMGRKIAVMRRWGYDWENNGQGLPDQGLIKQEEGGKQLLAEREDMPANTGPTNDIESQETIQGGPSTPQNSVHFKPQTESHPVSTTDGNTHDPPLWALNLETLSKTSAYSTTSTNHGGLVNGLPIYDPHAAWNYMLKSFATAASSSPPAVSPVKRPKSAALAKEREEKENNLGLLLYALDLLFASWIDVIGKEELDRRAFGWYSRVRPAVSDGVAGWGGKGDVRLADLLNLRR